jgi:hypothetical protein
MGFKLAVVEQVERGEMTDKQAQREYGIRVKTTDGFHQSLPIPSPILPIPPQP